MKLHTIVLIVLLLFTPLITSQGKDSKKKKSKIYVTKGVKSLDFISKLELGVYRELNLARTDPAGYAELLTEFRKYYRGNYREIPGEITIVTREGLKAVDETIAFLKKQKPLEPFRLSKGMTLAAQDLVKYQGPRGEFGHTGKDGSRMTDRLSRYGTWKVTCGENAGYGANDARRIVFDLIIDDGVSSRGHRENIFNPKFTVVGIGCGPHKKYKYMCIMDFAGGYIEKIE